MPKPPLSLLAALPALVVALAPQSAQAVPKLLITDFTGGNILEFTALDGGDISANVFASGLSEPAGLCVGPNNDIYVAEFQSGEITIATEGGDLSAAPAFARLPEAGAPQLSPAGIWCSDVSVIIAEAGPAGIVFDISAGGTDFNQWGIHILWNAKGGPRPLPIDIARDGNGDFFASSTIGVFDANVGADAAAPAVIALGAGDENVIPLEVLGTQLLGGGAPGGIIYDLTGAAAVDLAPPFATVPTPASGGILALLNAGDMGVFAATFDGVYDITAGGDLTAAVPVATGLPQSGIVLIDMVYHECATNDDCLDADLCNGEEVCELGLCGPPAEELDCDDDDVCTADSCDAIEGCANDDIDSCCESDLECAIDEVCDTDSNECVPASSPTSTGGSETTDSSTETNDPGTDTFPGTDTSDPGTTSGPGTTTAPSTTATATATATAGETDGDTDTDGAGADDDSGCSCRADANTAPPGVLLLGLLGLVFTRRRRT